MNECYGKKFILNGELLPSDIFDNSLVYDGDSIYEVIRMVKGSPLFFTDHMERLSTSIKLKRKEQLADASALRKAILTITRADRMKVANLKIVFNYNRGVQNYLVYFIEPVYPTKEQYLKGVKGVFFYEERIDPESKVINHKLRSSIYFKLIQDGAYEALLVNKQNQITEGSRSNIFFVKDEKLVTAPDNVILNGITRKHILDICNDNKINVDMTCVNVEDISKYDAVFMTGTSPVVLPFCCINNIMFNTGLPVIEKLRKLYIQKAEDSIHSFRTEL